MRYLRSPDTACGVRPGDELRGEAGLETVEYALIAAVMLTALFVVMPVFANNLAPAYNAVMNALINAMN